MLIIETPRLILREFTFDDGRALADILGDPRVMQYSLHGPKSPAQTLPLIQQMRDLQQARGFALWAVVRKADRRMVGYCGLIPQRLDGGEVIEIGYRFNPAVWGRGLGGEAAVACRDFAAQTLGLKRLVSLIMPDNTPSCRVAEKMGMTYESDTFMEGHPVRVYGLVLP